MAKQDNQEQNSLIPEVLRRAMAAGNDAQSKDHLFPIDLRFNY